MYPFTRVADRIHHACDPCRRWHFLDTAKSCVDSKLCERGGCCSEVVFVAGVDRCALAHAFRNPPLPCFALCVVPLKRVSSRAPHALMFLHAMTSAGSSVWELSCTRVVTLLSSGGSSLFGLTTQVPFVSRCTLLPKLGSFRSSEAPLSREGETGGSAAFLTC